MTSNYSKSLYYQYEELVTKFEKQELLLKDTDIIYVMMVSIIFLKHIINISNMEIILKVLLWI